MTDLPITQKLHRRGHWAGPADSCTLDYDMRFIRRKRLITDCGKTFVVDLEQTTSLDQGDALELLGGGLVEIRAASEAVLMVRGPNLSRLAWHIGNRHTPCEIRADYLLIREDRVIAHMLEHLGAELTPVELPFTPEGGAFGHGRTHSHEHGATAHEH